MLKEKLNPYITPAYKSIYHAYNSNTLFHFTNYLSIFIGGPKSMQVSR